MWTLHGDTLRDHSISTGTHAPVGIFASQVHTGLHSHSARGRERFASIQQFVEAIAGARTATGRAELDVTRLLAALGARSVQAHRECIENAALVGQHDVAGALREHGPDFTREIESPIDLAGELRAQNIGGRVGILVNGRVAAAPAIAASSRFLYIDAGYTAQQARALVAAFNRQAGIR